MSFGKGFGAARPYPTENLHNKHLVLCEGELDALALIGHGIPYQRNRQSIALLIVNWRCRKSITP